MATDSVDIVLSVKGNAVQNTYKVTEAMNQLNYVIDETGAKLQSVSDTHLVSVEKKFDKATNYIKKGFGEGSLTKLRNFGKEVRSLHIYGIDPITRSFAKLGSTILGSAIHPITIAATALMGAFVAVRKYIQSAQKYISSMVGKYQFFVNIVKQEISSIEKQKSTFKQIFDELEKINQKEQLSILEQDKTLMLVEQIKNKWGQVGIQIDKATGRIMNLNEVQGKIAGKMMQQQKQKYDQIIDATKKELDAMVFDLVGSKWKKIKLFSGKPEDIEKRDIAGITAQDFFGWGKQWNNPNVGNNLDMTQLLFGNTSQKLQFFRQMATDLTGMSDERRNKLNQIVSKVIELQGYEQKKREAISPYKDLDQRRNLMDSNAKSLIKEYQDYRKKYEELDKSSLDRANKREYESLKTPQQKINYKKNELDNVINQTRQLLNERDKLDQANKDTIAYMNSLQIDQNGNLVSDVINKMTQQNKDVAKLYGDYQKIEERYQKQIQDTIIPLYKDLEKAKRINELVQRKNEAGYYLELTDEQKWAKEFAQNFNSMIGQKWDKITKAQKNQMDQNFNVIAQHLGGQDNPLLKQFDEEFKRMTDAKIFLKKLTPIYDRLKQLGLSEDAIMQQIESLFETIQKTNKELAKKIQDQRTKMDGLLKPILQKYYQDNGMKWAWRQKEIQRQMRAILGRQLNSRQKDLAKRLTQIERLQDQNKQQNQNSPFKYGVKTNELAARGGWNSSVYVSGKDTLMQQQVKTSVNQEKILKLINKTQSEMKVELNALKKSVDNNLKIQ